MPVYYVDYFHYDIKNISLKKGAFSWKQKDTLEISVETNYEITDVGVLPNYDKYITRVSFNKNFVPVEDVRLHIETFADKKQRVSYVFKYAFMKKEKKTDFTLYLNGNCVAEYLINVK